MYRYAYITNNGQGAGILDDEPIHKGVETLSGAVKYILEMAWDEPRNESDVILIYRNDIPAAMIRFVPEYLTCKPTSRSHAAAVYAMTPDGETRYYVAEEFGYPRVDSVFAVCGQSLRPLSQGVIA